MGVTWHNVCRQNYNCKWTFSHGHDQTIQINIESKGNGSNVLLAQTAMMLSGGRQWEGPQQRLHNTHIGSSQPGHTLGSCEQGAICSHVVWITVKLYPCFCINPEFIPAEFLKFIPRYVHIMPRADCSNWPKVWGQKYQISSSIVLENKVDLTVRTLAQVSQGPGCQSNCGRHPGNGIRRHSHHFSDNCHY